MKLRPKRVACYLRTRGLEDFRKGRLVFMYVWERVSYRGLGFMVSLVFGLCMSRVLNGRLENYMKVTGSFT